MGDTSNVHNQVKINIDKNLILQIPTDDSKSTTVASTTPNIKPVSHCLYQSQTKTTHYGVKGHWLSY